MPTRPAALLAAVGLAAAAQAQAPVLVEDVNATVAGLSGLPAPNTPVKVGNLAFFSADDGVNGRELWVTDGTDGGTRLVKNINPTGDSSPGSLTPLANGALTGVLFSANDGTNGAELWFSDGTEANTVLVKNIRTGSAASSPGSTLSMGSYVLFTADEGSTAPGRGRELWRSDGTDAGTVLVKDVRPGTPSGLSSVSGLTRLGDNVYFRAVSGSNGVELWRTDGTAAGTILVADPSPATSDLGDAADPRSFVAFNGMLYFVAGTVDSTSTQDGNVELWRHDPVANTTAEFAAINPATSGLAASGLPSDPEFTVVGSNLYFVANDGTGPEVWSTDATGVSLLVDLHPIATAPAPKNLRALGTGLVFSANDGVNGEELWVSAGAGTGASMVKNINASGSSSPVNFTVVQTPAGPRLFFAAGDGLTGNELYVSDGSLTGTAMVADLRPGGGTSNGNPVAMMDFNGVLLFSAEVPSVGRELFRSDGTPAGTALVKDIRVPNVTADAFASPFHLFGSASGRLYFRATDGTPAGAELWSSDGTTPGTALLADINPAGDSSPANFAEVGATVYFAASDGSSGTELWKRTAAGSTARVRDIAAGTGGSFPAALTRLGDTLFFTATDGAGGQELWKSDGTEAGTALVEEINPGGAAFSGTPALAVYNGRVFFAASDGASGTELWSADGTGADRVADVAPGTGSSSPFGLTVAGDTLFFAANDGTTGTELWKHDGVATTQVRNIRATTASALASSSFSPAALGTTLYFVANDGAGNQLWKSVPPYDQASTTPVTTGAWTAAPSALTASGSALFFVATDAANGAELWRTEGTGAQVVNVAPGATGSAPANPLDVDGVLYFSANDGANGTELWRIASTPGATPERVSNFAAAAAEVANLRRAGDTLFFTALEAPFGRELYALDVGSPCAPDFDDSGAVDVSDIFAFLSAWFAQGAGSDFNNSGATDVSDIFAFLSAWFAGC